MFLICPPQKILNALPCCYSEGWGMALDTASGLISLPPSHSKASREAICLPEQDCLVIAACWRAASGHAHSCASHSLPRWVTHLALEADERCLRNSGDTVLTQHRILAPPKKNKTKQTTTKNRTEFLEAEARECSHNEANGAFSTPGKDHECICQDLYMLKDTNSLGTAWMCSAVLPVPSSFPRVPWNTSLFT